MAKNVPIIVTSIIVVTLFVLLVYPAIIPINAPPVLKSLKDIFVAVLSLVLILTSFFLLTERFFATSFNLSEITFDASLLCTLRC